MTFSSSALRFPVFAASHFERKMLRRCEKRELPHYQVLYLRWRHFPPRLYAWLTRRDLRRRQPETRRGTESKSGNGHIPRHERHRESTDQIFQHSTRRRARREKGIGAMRGATRQLFFRCHFRHAATGPQVELQRSHIASVFRLSPSPSRPCQQAACRRHLPEPRREGLPGHR